MSESLLSDQLQQYQELERLHARMAELEKSLAKTPLAPSVALLLGKTKTAPKKKAGKKTAPNKGGVKKPKKAKKSE